MKLKSTIRKLLLNGFNFSCLCLDVVVLSSTYKDIINNKKPQRIIKKSIFVKNKILSIIVSLVK